jgi:NAD(P)-dependent dehydrogenase (short-subunit alcohol dehydrogenase family)
MSSFEGKSAIVTGGASGIGRALCEAMAARGAIVVVADLDEAAAGEVARAICARGGRAEAAAVDVCDPAAVKRIVDDTTAARGRLDYMFNNAGIGVFGEERDVSLDDWRRVLDVDLYGVVHGVRAAYPVMVRQGHGHIVNTASVAGLVPCPLEISYTTAKYGVVGLSQALRAEGARLGVKVSVVCPGFIDTAILQRAELRTSVERSKLLAMIPKPMPAERCAQVILDGVERNRSTILVTAHAKALYWLNRVSPDISVRIARALVDKVRALANSRT